MVELILCGAEVGDVGASRCDDVERPKMLCFS